MVAGGRLLKGALAVALTLAACGPCTSEATGADMDRLAAAFANNVVECNPRSAFEQELEPEDPRDTDQITNNFSTYFRLLLEDELVTVDKEALDSCVTFLESEDACEGFGGDEEGDCDRVFSGTLEGGQRCALREQCASDICVFGGAAACGTCAEATEGELGEFCGVRVCGDGLFCQYDNPDGPVCEQLRAEGEACFEEVLREDVFFACEAGLGCADEDQLCYALVEEDGDCAGGKKCASGLVCRGDEGDETCVPELIGTEVGDLCDPLGDACGLTLETGLACGGRDAATSCVAAQVVDEGEACDGGSDEDDKNATRWCRYGLTTHYCHENLDGTAECRQRPGVGDDCRGRPCDVHEGGCVIEDEGRSARCRPWPDEGEACFNVAGTPTCGPDLFCNNGPGGAVCTSSPLPTTLPQCG